MQRVSILAAVVLFGFCAIAAQAAPARILTHTHGSGSSAVVVTLVDILPNGPVRILSSSPSARVRHTISHAQFEQMWTTLLASGAKKLQPSKPSRIVDGVHNYVFSLAEVPAGTGRRFIIPKDLIVPVRHASPAVISVSRQIRGLLQI